MTLGAKAKGVELVEKYVEERLVSKRIVCFGPMKRKTQKLLQTCIRIL